MLKRFTVNKTALTAAAIILVLGSSCSIQQKSATDTKDLSYIYNPAKNGFKPDISVFNEDAETSVLSIGIPRSQFQFSEANPEGVAKASVLLSVKLYDNTLGGILADTAQFKYDLSRDEFGGAYIFHVPLKAYEGKSYSVETKIIDLIRQRTVQTFTDFERTGRYSKLNYKIRDYFSRNELQSNVIKRDPRGNSGRYGTIQV